MKNEILKNLNNIDNSRYDEMSILLNKKLNLNDYFLSNYNSIMEKWNKNNAEFNIPNILVEISIDGNSSYYKNSNILNDNTIFDLASITKLYTEMILFEVINDYNLSLNTKINDITHLYKSISNLTLMDLISFNNTYKTKEDIRTCKNKEDALKALRDVYIIKENKNKYLYSDLPIMVLTDILEMYTGFSYKELFDKYIIKKYNLKNTFLEINNENYLTINKNAVNDPKANIMGGYYGHCGVKSNSHDLLIFLNNVLDCKYFNLFINTSNTIDNNGDIKRSKGLIGNSNINAINYNSLASSYLPKLGFAIQGSLRCHAELYKIKINNTYHRITTCIFTDLYTQEKNIKEYEKNHNIKISNEIKLDNGNTYKMYDIRSILSYDLEYKEIVNLVSRCSLLKLNEFISNP